MLEGGITDDDDDDDNAVERNNNPNNNASLYDIDGNYIGTLNDFEVTGLVQNAKDEATRRSTLEETYLTPLEDEHCLLSNDSAAASNAVFNADAKTEEISDILQNQKVVEELFSLLVPREVTYEEFWERYFYRCDEASKFMFIEVSVLIICTYVRTYSCEFYFI